MRIKAPAMRIKALVATRAGYTATCVVAAIATTLVFAFRRGQDVNWDQLNYHLVVPFLLLHGTFWDSIAPAGIQSYLNPLVLVPQYIVIRLLPPLAAVTTIDVAQAMAFVIAGGYACALPGPTQARAGMPAPFSGLCFACQPNGAVGSRHHDRRFDYGRAGPAGVSSVADPRRLLRHAMRAWPLACCLARPPGSS